MEDETYPEELQEAMEGKPIIKSEWTRDPGEPTEQPDGLFTLKEPFNGNKSDNTFGASGKLTLGRAHT